MQRDFHHGLLSWLAPTPDEALAGDSGAGERRARRHVRDPIQPRASDIAPLGHYVVIQGAGAGGGEPGTANYGRGEAGAFAVGLHQASAGATYYADVGVGANKSGAGGGDHGALAIVEIGA